MPVSTRGSEDSPLPDGPTTAVSLPGAKPSDTPRSACTAPVGVRYVLTRSTQRAGIGSLGNAQAPPPVNGGGPPVDEPPADHRHHGEAEHRPREDRGRDIEERGR